LLKRNEILDVSYSLMLEKGYEGTGIQDITDKIKATKGCLYYHFKSKRDIAAAVIKEIIKPIFINNWGELYKADDTIDEICCIIDRIYAKNGKNLAKNGCPVGNLMLELSTKDKILSKYINEIIELWGFFIEKALEKAMSAGIIKKDLNVKSTANFIIGSFEGCIMLSKSSNNQELLKDCFSNLKNYINALKI